MASVPQANPTHSGNMNEPRHSPQPKHAAGLFETDYAPGGLVGLVGIDFDGNVQLTATVTRDYSAWLVAGGHIADATDRLEGYTKHERPPLVLMKNDGPALPPPVWRKRGGA